MAESYRNWPEYQSAEALYDEFALTTHGETLRNASRYDMYRNERRFTNEDWWRLLGRDANNLMHMSVTLAYAAHLERRKPVPNSSPVRGRILKAAGGHDNAEAITSDVLYIYKNESHFTIEKEAFFAHLPEFYASDESREDMAEIAKNLIFDDSSPEGREFNMVEQIGYLQTSLKAWAIATDHDDRALKRWRLKSDDKWQHGTATEEGRLTADDRIALFGITASVLGSTLDKALEYYDAGSNPEFNQFINNRRRLISKAFENMPEEAFRVFGVRQEERSAKFQEAKVQWSKRFADFETKREAA